MTTAGDIIYGDTSGVPTRLGKGTSGYVLTQGATYPSWAASPSAAALYANGAEGTIYYADGAGDAAELVVGTAGQVLTAQSGGSIAWNTPASGLSCISCTMANMSNSVAETTVADWTIPANTINDGDGFIFTLGFKIVQTTGGSASLLTKFGVNSTNYTVNAILGYSTGTNVRGFLSLYGLRSGNNLIVADGSSTPSSVWPWNGRLATGLSTSNSYKGNEFTSVTFSSDVHVKILITASTASTSFTWTSLSAGAYKWTVA
jgi:hypothetical protein